MAQLKANNFNFKADFLHSLLSLLISHELGGGGRNDDKKLSAVRLMQIRQTISLSNFHFSSLSPFLFSDVFVSYSPPLNFLIQGTKSISLSWKLMPYCRRRYTKRITRREKIFGIFDLLKGG